jgi:eukaryotic-like serine/threonine-protein kinase
MNANHHDLLFGLLALQNGLIDQGQLVAAFQAWTREKVRPLAELLIARGDLDSEQRAGIEAMVALHLKKHGSDTGRSLAAIPAHRSTRESLARIGDPEIGASLGHVGSAHRSTEEGDLGDRTVTYSVGTATSDGQRFRVLRPHARGGLGAVFVALDGELHREVALKQILEKHADDPASRQRFVAEAEITGGLEHPGVVPVYGLGTDAGGHPYYAMRFIKGDSLKEAIERFHMDEALKKDPGGRSLELRKLLGRFTDVCNAVDYAHSRGVIHRDLKPANIIVGKHGETLVVDWGLAKLVGRADPSGGEQTIAPSSGGSSETLPGSALGTPPYMSPEQARGDLDKLGPRSDVYSLGATLYCMLTGKPPFDVDDVGAILRAVQEGRFQRPSQHHPSLDKSLEAVCLKAMSTRPEDRYATAKAVADDLERWMADEPVSAWREPLARRARRWGRRNRTAVAAAVAALVVALGALSVGTVLIGWQRSVALEQRDLARGNLEQARRIVDEMYTQVADGLTDARGMEPYQREILDKALRFYESVALPQSQAPEIRYETGRARFRVAEIRYKFSQIEQAEAAYKQALSIFEPLAADYPDRAEFSQAFAGNLKSLAILYMSTARLDQAEAMYEKAASTSQKLIDDHPEDVAYRLGLARTENSRGILYKRIHRLEDCEAALKRAEALDRELIEGHPEDHTIRGHLARVLINLGVSLDPAFRRAEIESKYDQALLILRKLVVEQPRVVEYQSELAGLMMSLGALYSRTGRPDQAEAANEKAIAIQRRLTDDHPDRVDFADELGLSYYSMSYMKQLKRDFQGAHDWANRAIQAFETSLRREPRRADIKELLGFAFHARAQALTDQYRAAEALRDWDRAIELADKDEERIHSLTASRALVLAYQGETRRAVAAIAAVPRTGAYSGVIFYNEACIFALAAAAAAAANDVTSSPEHRAALVEQYAARAMSALAEARRLGYFRDASKVANIRSDRDVDALRARPDFQVLLLDLAFPTDPFAPGR